jgi:hypothetical protein
VVNSKWIYNNKHATDGNIKKYKARFVARGFSHKEGVDYEENFSPVARYTSINVIISLTSVMGWRLHQMDVKTVFLDIVIDEEVYIEKHQVFLIHGNESHVCRLNKALHGLKHAPKGCTPGFMDT